MAECIVVDVHNSNCSNNNTNNNNNKNNNCITLCEDEAQTSDANNQLVLLSVNVLSDASKVVNDKSNLNNFFLFKEKIVSDVVVVGDKTTSVQQTGVIATEDQESVCSEEDNCRKKRRCTDRYDSSESSDR